MTALVPRLDHVVIGVRDLDTAESLLCSRGFRSNGGGSHPGFGTENRLVRFQSEYLEVIAVADPDAARAAGRGTLVDRLAAGAEGFVAFALRGFPVEHVIDRAAGVGIEVRGPVAMSRRSATGTAAAWRLVIPHGDQYGGWWPFFIEWADGGPGSNDCAVADQPNGATHVSEVTIGTADLDPVRALFEDALGMPPRESPPHSDDPGHPTGSDRHDPGPDREASYPIGHTLLRFVAKSRDGDHGQVREGVMSVRIETDPDAAPFPEHPRGPDWLRRIHLASARRAPHGPGAARR